MKQRGKTLVPRNPYAVAASLRKAGAHDKTAKIRRRDAKQALQRAVRQGKEADFLPGGRKSAFSVTLPV